MIATDHGRGWWALEIEGKRGRLLVEFWPRPIGWLWEGTRRYDDGWDWNGGPLSLEWRKVL